MAAFEFVSAILPNEPIEIYGEGQLSRDFTRIDDLVESIVRLASQAAGQFRIVPRDTRSRQAPFRVVNFGRGNHVAFLKLVETIEAALDKPAVRKMLIMQLGDVPRLFASLDLVLALTNDKPATDISAGIREFVKWYWSYYEK